MNFGLLNLTKQKKKSRNTTKCHTKKKFRNITKRHFIFVIFFISNCGRSQFDILLFNFYVHSIFHNKILGKKLLLVLKLCIKRKKKRKKEKNNTRKLCAKCIVNFGSPNLTIYTKKEV